MFLSLNEKKPDENFHNKILILFGRKDSELILDDFRKQKSVFIIFNFF